MQPYPPGKPIEEVQRELGLDSVVKLASNENPYGSSPKAYEAISNAVKGVHLYPDARSWSLKEQLSQSFDVGTERILVGAGSDEIIGVLGLMFLDPSSNIVVGNPSFIRYDSAAKLAGSEVRKVELDSEFCHNLSAMANQIDEQTRLVFVANPNNPTGTIVRDSELRSFARDLPETCVLILDEAYFEYAQESDQYPNGLQMLKEGMRVIALRTMSKGYGLAGMRIGYGFADPEVVRAYDSTRAPFDINVLAQSAAIASLKDQSFLSQTLKNNAYERDRFYHEMKELGLDVIASQTNFVCVNVQGSGIEIFENLMAQGFIVRPGEPLGLPGFIRVSLGTSGEMTSFYEAFKLVMRNLGRLDRKEVAKS